MPAIPSPRAKKRARIEIIPLIDIIFFLLATFMMVSISMIHNEGIKVDLPPAKTAGRQNNKNNPAVISINSAGKIFFQKEECSLQQLQTQLVNLKEINPDSRLVIQSDQKASFKHVIAVLDTARAQGLAKFTIRTAKPASP